MMGFLDAILGRSKPAKPNLDVLFAVPAASLTLQAGLGLEPTGAGAVCFTSAEGQSAEQARTEALALLSPGSAQHAESTRDEYGYTWITVRRPDADLATLVTDLHAVNSTLAEAGYGPTLLCTVIAFAGTIGGHERRVALVYLFKRGTFYPFVPTGGRSRDNQLELQIRDRLAGELPIEGELSRWFPIWDAPVP